MARRNDVTRADLVNAELAANKVLALFGQVQTRDLADLAALAEVLSLEDMLADAKLKDPGFSRRSWRRWSAR